MQPWNPGPIKTGAPLHEVPPAASSGTVGPMIDHISLQTDHYSEAVTWYDTMLGTVGGERLMDIGGFAAGYGPPGGAPSFWLGQATTPLDGKPTSPSPRLIGPPSARSTRRR